MDAELAAQCAALPDDVDALKAALLAARADVAAARAEQSSNLALIAHLKLQIEKLNRDGFGTRSERTARLLEQMELEFEELEASATEDELATVTAATKTTSVAGFTRTRPARRPFPCTCRGGTRRSKLGEDVTESLEAIPRQWRVIQHVRETFSCRDCERISQPPAPFHVIPRGRAGPNLLAMMLFEKFGQHRPLSRQAERYGREGVPLSLSTLADAYGGYGKLYEPGRIPGPISEAACWAHARRKFFVLADVADNARRAARSKTMGTTPAVLSPICLDAVQRIDALFDIERDINGNGAEARRAARQALSAPKVAELQGWLGMQRSKLARGNDIARAIDYLLKRWPAFTRFLDDGRVCLSNNADERALRGIALGRKSWLFCGSDRGRQRAAVMSSLIVTAKMNDVDPQAWLADVLCRIDDHFAFTLNELLPWNWRTTAMSDAQAA